MNSLPKRTSREIDTVARRTFALDNAGGGTGTLNVAVPAGGRAVVQISEGSPKIVTGSPG